MGCLLIDIFGGWDSVRPTDGGNCPTVPIQTGRKVPLLDDGGRQRHLAARSGLAGRLTNFFDGKTIYEWMCSIHKGGNILEIYRTYL